MDLDFSIPGELLYEILSNDNLNIHSELLDWILSGDEDIPKPTTIEAMHDDGHWVITNLDLSYLEIESIPKTFRDIKVYGNLDLSNNLLAKLPETFSNIKIHGNLNLSSNDLESLPLSFGDIQVGGNIYFNDNDADMELSNVFDYANKFVNLGGVCILRYNDKFVSTDEFMANAIKVGKLRMTAGWVVMHMGNAFKKGESNEKLHKIIDMLPDQRSRDITLSYAVEKLRSDKFSNVQIIDAFLAKGVTTFDIANAKLDERKAKRLLKRAIQNGQDYNSSSSKTLDMVMEHWSKTRDVALLVAIKNYKPLTIHALTKKYPQTIEKISKERLQSAFISMMKFSDGSDDSDNNSTVHHENDGVSVIEMLMQLVDQSTINSAFEKVVRDEFNPDVCGSRRLWIETLAKRTDEDTIHSEIKKVFEARRRNEIFKLLIKDSNSTIQQSRLDFAAETCLHYYWKKGEKHDLLGMLIELLELGANISLDEGFIQATKQRDQQFLVKVSGMIHDQNTLYSGLVRAIHVIDAKMISIMLEKARFEKKTLDSALQYAIENETCGLTTISAMLEKVGFENVDVETRRELLMRAVEKMGGSPMDSVKIILRLLPLEEDQSMLDADVLSKVLSQVIPMIELPRRKEAVTALLEKGANPNYVSPGGTPIFITALRAAIKDQTEIGVVKILLQHPQADVNKAETYGKLRFTPLYIAASGLKKKLSTKVYKPYNSKKKADYKRNVLQLLLDAKADASLDANEVGDGRKLWVSPDLRHTHAPRRVDDIETSFKTLNLRIFEENTPSPASLEMLTGDIDDIDVSIFETIPIDESAFKDDNCDNVLDISVDKRVPRTMQQQLKDMLNNELGGQIALAEVNKELKVKGDQLNVPMSESEVEKIEQVKLSKLTDEEFEKLGKISNDDLKAEREKHGEIAEKRQERETNERKIRRYSGGKRKHDEEGGEITKPETGNLKDANEKLLKEINKLECEIDPMKTWRLVMPIELKVNRLLSLSNSTQLRKKQEEKSAIFLNYYNAEEKWRFENGRDVSMETIKKRLTPGDRLKIKTIDEDMKKIKAEVKKVNESISKWRRLKEADGTVKSIFYHDKKFWESKEAAKTANFIEKEDNFVFVVQDITGAELHDVLCYDRLSLLRLLENGDEFLVECIGRKLPIDNDPESRYANAEERFHRAMKFVDKEDSVLYAGISIGDGEARVDIRQLKTLMLLLDKGVKVFYITPRLVNGVQQMLTHTASYKNAYPEGNENLVSANHCQWATNMPIYDIKLCVGGSCTVSGNSVMEAMNSGEIPEGSTRQLVHNVARDIAQLYETRERAFEYEDGIIEHAIMRCAKFDSDNCLRHFNLSNIKFDDTRGESQVCGITELPTTFGHLKFRGNLCLTGEQLTSLPEEFGNIRVGGKLNLSHNKLTSLPEEFGNIKVGGDLFLDDNQLTSLPEGFGNIKVGGDLLLNDNLLTSLSAGFGSIEVGGELDLSHNQLTSLPEGFGNITVGGDLDLSHNQLISPPEGFDNVGGYVDFSDNQPTSLGDSDDDGSSGGDSDDDGSSGGDSDDDGSSGR